MVCIQNSKLVMLSTAYLKDEIKPGQIPVSFINVSHDVIKVVKYTLTGSLQLYVDYQQLQGIKKHKLGMEQSDTTLPCTLPSAKFVYSPTEVNAQLGMEQSDTTLPCTLTSAKFVYFPTEVNTHRKSI